MNIINSTLSWYLKKRVKHIERFMNNPHEVQNNVLMKLINSAKSTEWGKKHDYRSIKNYDDFKNRVPVSDYKAVKPYINRMIKGEKNVLWPGKVRWYAKSSGTTSDKSKFIPLSNESLHDCHYQGGRDVLSIYCHNRPNTKIFNGKGLTIGGSHNVSELNKESCYGDLSAILLQNLPAWVEMLRTPKVSTALMDDWEKKLDKVAKETIKQNVTNVSGVPSWNLILFDKILNLTGKENLLEVWPNLELFAHGGVSFVPYRHQFERLIPSEEMYYLETYNASEGFFALQDIQNSEEMLLMLDYGVFYEFMPMGELDKESPQILSLDQVEEGKNYALIITTNGGLWRYMIGDTVLITNTKPFRIKVSGRTQNFINAFGEEVIVDNVDNALNKTCKATGAVIKEYTGAPVYLNEKQNAAHEYLIEFERKPQDIQKFADIFDKELQKINSDYEAKRSKNIMLKNLIVQDMPEGTFYYWMKKRGKIGGQNKVPRLYNNRKYVDDILAFQHSLQHS